MKLNLHNLPYLYFIKNLPICKHYFSKNFTEKANFINGLYWFYWEYLYLLNTYRREKYAFVFICGTWRNKWYNRIKLFWFFVNFSLQFFRFVVYYRWGVIRHHEAFYIGWVIECMGGDVYEQLTAISFSGGRSLFFSNRFNKKKHRWILKRQELPYIISNRCPILR